MHAPLDQVAAEISAASFSRPELEGNVYQFSPQQWQLVLRLAAGPADTRELRTGGGLGNIGQAARMLNANLQRVGDLRRVTCAMRIDRDRFGASVRTAEWRLTDGGGDVRACA